MDSEASDGSLVNGLLDGVKPSAADLQKLFDLVPDLLCIAGFDGYFKELNPAWELMLGYTREELLSKPFKEFVHPDDRDNTVAETKNLGLGKNTFNFINRYIAKDGTLHWLSWKCASFVSRRQIYGSAQDITFQKNASEALAKNQANLANAQRIAHLGSWEFDFAQLDNRESLFWSEETYRIFGYDPGVKTPAHDLFFKAFDASQKERIAQAVAKALEQNLPYELEHPVRRPNGEERIVQERAEIIRNTAGDPLRMIGTVLDITDLRKAEEGLHKTEEMYRQVLDAIADMVFVKSPKSRIRWANKAFRDCYGMSQEQLRDMIDAPFNEPDYTQQYIKDDAWVFETGKTLDIPSESVTRHDGVVRQVHTVKTAILDSNEKVVLLVGVSRDITDSRKLEAIVRQSEKMSAVGQLAAGVAHEINNPLAVILGFSQGILGRLVPSDALFGPTKVIERETLRCSNLVRDLLTFSRDLHANITLEPLLPMIESALNLVETQARIKKIDVRRDFIQEPVLIRADRTQIQQVLINLCANAMDAMPAGGTLTIGITKLKKTVEIRVSDTGTGIATDIKDRIFEPFFTTKPVGQGTGLGLSLVYETVKKHEGRILCDTRVGEGTTFTICLPVQ